MSGKLKFCIMLFTLFVCCLFVFYNPTITAHVSDDITDGEVFTSQKGQFDFRIIKLNSSADNFTSRHITNGHIQLYDDTGNVTVNIIQYDKMIHYKRDGIESFFKSELETPSWTVDGVSVHEIDFLISDTLYSAYVKNSTTDTVVYLSTPNESETAAMVNSLSF